MLAQQRANANPRNQPSVNDKCLSLLFISILTLKCLLILALWTATALWSLSRDSGSSALGSLMLRCLLIPACAVDGYSLSEP